MNISRLSAPLARAGDFALPSARSRATTPKQAGVTAMPSHLMTLNEEESDSVQRATDVDPSTSACATIPLHASE